MSITHLKAGDKAPSFELQNQNEELVSSQSLVGSKYILFFYPKDNTPGCTNEACNLRDNYSIFTKNNYKLLGISPDAPQKHVKFITKFELPFPLLADVDKKMLNDYGIWGPKKFMGKVYDGVHRTTFVVNEKGIISHIIDKVKTKEHAAQLIEILSLG